MVAVLDPLASYIQNMLMKMAKEEVHVLLGVTGEIDKMGIKLGDLKNFLTDDDRRNITDLTVQAWVRGLRDAMYDATDILDLCQLKAMEQGPIRDLGCFNPLLFCLQNPLHAHDIGSRIKNLNKRLDSIKARSVSLNFINLCSYEDHGRNTVWSSSSSRETSTGLYESGLVGERIEEDTRNLVKILTKECQSDQQYSKFMVFAIVGIGGIGKTTLAQKIFNNDIIDRGFTKKIWLSVNQEFNETEMLRRAISEAGGNHQTAGNTKATLERTLTDALKGHKILLIMDDVWDYSVWEGIVRTPLLNAALDHGSRVLVTTRHDTVARGMMAEEPYHRIDKLDPEDAWLLLKKQVVGSVNDEPQVEMLKDIGMVIVEKCDGLPLAVKVMGGLLRQKKIGRAGWQNVLNDSLWSVSEMPKDLNYSVYLSYQDLGPSLKPCFLHYSLLPKGTIFLVDDIVGMWISEGFVHGTSIDLEETGREYYDELIKRNLIEPNIRYIDQAVCNMHDVIRSFAQYVARDEALVAQNSEMGITVNEHKSQKLIRLSLANKGSESNNFEWCSLQAHKSLRTLILVGNIKIKQGDSLLFLSSLRTLHLESANVDALAESLHQLKHLRYLSIEKSNTSRLPENIGKLKLLQYISLFRCQSLVKLPCSIGKLQHLRFLKLSKTSINNIPDGFGGLTSLRKLYGFPAHMDGDRCSLEKLGPLSQLMEVGIKFLENVSSASFAIQARLSVKERLSNMSLHCTSKLGDDGRLVKKGGVSVKEQLQIEEVFDELCPPSCLENLVIEGYFGQRLPRWMMSTAVVPLGTLRVLTMSDLACCTELPNGLCHLPWLELLQIDRAPAIKRVGHGFLCSSRSQVAAGFSRLLKLNFIGMVEWEVWEWEEQVQALPVLEYLQLNRCKLSHVPPGLAMHTKNLRKLYVYDVEQVQSLEKFSYVVLLEVFRNTDLERISVLPSLQKLVISNCPKMKVLKDVPALQTLVLEDYGMETLPRYLQDVSPRHFELHCNLSLLTSIAAGKFSPDWDQFNHIQQVKAHANNQGNPRKWYVMYTRDPFRLETNISRSAIAKAHNERKLYAYLKTCTIEDERPEGRFAYVDKRQPLCLRFRCNSYRHLVVWLRKACLHCNEAVGVASLSGQWTEAVGCAAYIGYQTRYGRLQQQKEASQV
ncbi:unnamed protein product [Urochloa humidicola]